MKRPINHSAKTHRFSIRERAKWIEESDKRTIPLLIIGGGISGAGILLEASSRGIPSLLLEMGDFASGTSSKSTKLIHGGLRYLRNFEWRLVREFGRERSVLFQNAPYLVKPTRLILPIRKGGSLGKYSTLWAVRFYEWLIGIRPSEKHRLLSKSEVLLREPLLKKEGLRAGIEYTEYLSDDARLTMEVIKTALQFGARAVNYCKVTKITKEADYFRVHCEDQTNQRSFEIRALQVVNAGGPWLDQIRALDKHKEPARLKLSKGVHIVLSRTDFPLNQACYFDTQDGRMVFAIPRADNCYIGTTDTFFDGDPAQVSADSTDLNYLLEALRYQFSMSSEKLPPVRSSWAGLRPLLASGGKKPGEISRRDELLYSPDGMISVAGGKLTGYRVMAEKVGKQVRARLQAGKHHSATAHLKLSGWGEEKPEQLVSRLSSGKPVDYQRRVEELVSRYGKAAEKILEYAEGAFPGIQAELAYCQDFEMTIYPDDFWYRRTADAYFNPERMKEFTDIVEAQLVRHPD